MDNDHDQDITASRLFSCFSSNNSLVPTQTTQMPGHWLADSPGKLLDKFNIEQGLAGVDGFPYNVLVVRIFIFYKDAVLLTREGNDWTVPTMYFPEDTRNVASWDQISVPQNTNFRWVNNDHGAMINLSPQTTPSGGLTPETIQQAHQRLTTCSKHTLLGRAAASPNPQRALASVCNSMITSILITRAIVKGQDTPGYGRVLVDKAPGKRELFFSGNMSAEEFERTAVGSETLYTSDRDRVFIVAAKWSREQIVGVEQFAYWGEVFDLSGRLRENLGWDWD
ncbi:hypothetical protein M409DRAFT_54787 [Zasmidium cellare ATCC 36951]|uniref:Uncharacterized protein n=1 Tax=Zasmidium cellare ATCC 36951 TaxID=1080233 RepID=A0A6A6CJR7_ZASCE|nr:uncharacterized protein M409DRAFT_54787 [Zasmidium cellare ATCC 36951]KAF2166438.1 hypothetical protein M409DRAFT_54787 [Zasmidium cellare ATCC 36951]